MADETKGQARDLLSGSHPPIGINSGSTSTTDIPVQPEPCDLFRSAGEGPLGDRERALFCLCGWEFCEHGEAAR